MVWTELSFDPDSVASTSDVASSAMDLAASASDAASSATDKAAAASSAVAAKKNTLYNTTPADTVDDGFAGSFVASGVFARGTLGYVKAAGTVALANAASAATASGLLVLSPASVASTGSFAAIMPGTMVGHSAWNWTPGAPIFMGSSAGSMTQTKPSAASAIVRVVGYGGRNSNVMWFNPDNTWIEV